MAPSLKGGPGRGKGKGGKSWSKGSGKPSQAKNRAKSALHCIRCGAAGHWASNCPMPRNLASPTTPTTSPSSRPNKRPALEDGSALMAGILMDSNGVDRPDAVMLDPGASSFLAGYHTFIAYVQVLRQLGYPVELIYLSRCTKEFRFGGDNYGTSDWVVKVPMFVGGRYGLAECFLLPGHTPMLMGRPIMELLGMTLDFASQTMRVLALWLATVGVWPAR